MNPLLILAGEWLLPLAAAIALVLMWAFIDRSLDMYLPWPAYASMVVAFMLGFLLGRMG